MSMRYKSYVAGPIAIDEDAGTMSGTVHGLSKTTLHFTGTTAAELVASFRGTIDEYLAICRERGIDPERPYSGTITLRTSPDLHRKAAALAEAENTSINQWIARLIETA